MNVSINRYSQGSEPDSRQQGNSSSPTYFHAGKDILEILSTAMYVNPLSVYREYIQNSVDAIEDAKVNGTIPAGELGEVRITTDSRNRNITIRDNGSGISNTEFRKKMLTLGASTKRGTAARGFRGVGRIGGLGYCQELIFRSRSKKSEKVLEVRWNAKELRSLMREIQSDTSLAEAVKHIARIGEPSGNQYPDHFFEVVLVKPLRLKNDLLMNVEKVGSYLAQVAPVPFHQDFPFSNEITRHIEDYSTITEIDIWINKSEKPLYRPYRIEFDLTDSKTDSFNDIEFIPIAGHDTGICALGWILHHSYYGAIPDKLGLGGIRARVGNMQIGDNKLFADVFPESRFNSWSVGEFHIFDRRLVPNGRRDAFEENAHLSNLVTQLIPIAHQIASKCRTHSKIRNRWKSFESFVNKTNEKLDVYKTNALDKQTRAQIERDIGGLFHELSKLLESKDFPEKDRDGLSSQLLKLREKANDILGRSTTEDPLHRLPSRERGAFRRFLSLVYECSANDVIAKSLIDRILARL